MKEAHPNEESAVKKMLTTSVKREPSRLSKLDFEDKSEESSSYNAAKVEGYLQNVDPLKQNLIKSYYTLRLLKSREMKC
jgi:hypothetical protein